MPKVTLYNMAGESVGEVELSEAVFGITPNTQVMHDAVRNYLANQRQGTQSTLTRAEVRGGGRKPWRQKGTGRARQGSIRAPQWYHGGVALGPKPRSYSFTLNKKIKRLALLSAFSTKQLGGDIIVVDEIKMDEYKTKGVIEMLKALGIDKKALFVTGEKCEKFVRSASNLPKIKTAMVNTINVYDILNYDKLILSKDAVTMLEEVYA
jgi:large subunit ribosomal protein L4